MPALKDPKHEKFAQEYCVDFNATQAARRAGYSKKTAKQQGSRLLTNVDISQRVHELATKDITKVEMNPERIIRELSFLGTADVSKAFDDDGNLLPIQDIPEEVRRSIAGFELIEERDETGAGTGTFTKKVKFWDKNTSLLGLAKVFKMLVDVKDVKHTVTLETFLGGTWPEEDQKGSSPKDKKK